MWLHGKRPVCRNVHEDIRKDASFRAPADGAVARNLAIEQLKTENPEILTYMFDEVPPAHMFDCQLCDPSGEKTSVFSSK